MQLTSFMPDKKIIPTGAYSQCSPNLCMVIFAYFPSIYNNYGNFLSTSEFSFVLEHSNSTNSGFNSFNIYNYCI